MKRTLTLLLLLALTTAPLRAHALDAKTSAATMAQQASKAYEGGDYARAADLYLNAWKTDARPAYLWALARAEHLAGKHDKALEHYRLFLLAPGDQASRVPRATEYMDAIVAQRVDQRTSEADNALRSGEPRLAAQLYLDAFKLADSRATGLLFKAAVAEQAAELWPAAAAHYEAFLKAAPADAPDRGQAEVRLDAVRARAGLQHPAAAVSLPDGPTAAVAPAVTLGTAERPGGAGPWVLLAGGGFVAAGGATLLALTWPDRSALVADLEQKQGGKISGVTQEEAVGRIDSVNQRLGAGAALAATGLVAAGVGAWWLGRAPGAVSLVPGPRAAGVGVALRF